MTRQPYAHPLHLALAALLAAACGDAMTMSASDVTDVSSTGEDATTDETSSTGATETGDADTTSTAAATSEGPDTEGACGDGTLDANEECDDGNGDDDDECANDCTYNQLCGNGDLEGAEECDDGNRVDDDLCANDCTLNEYCGNGKLEGEEKCDDGNDVPDDGCESDCTPSEKGDCGNGVVEWNESCDDANDINNDGCTNDCVPTPDEVCQPDPASYASCDEQLAKGNTLAPFRAIDVGCSDVVNETIFASDMYFVSANPNAWQIASGFGTHAVQGDLVYSPRKGDAFLMLSTGVITPPNQDGVVVEFPSSQVGNGENGNDDSNTLPSPIEAVDGSNNGMGGDPFTACDGVGDCSDTLAAEWMLNMNPQDKMWFGFSATPPEATAAFAMEFAFCSSEWPLYANTPFTDIFVMWEVSEAYTGNTAHLDGRACTISGLNQHLNQYGFTGDDPELDGTGFEGYGCTDWLTIKHNVAAGEPLDLTFFIADRGDSILATAVLLDGFHWSCEACVAADTPPCQEPSPHPSCCGISGP